MTSIKLKDLIIKIPFDCIEIIFSYTEPYECDTSKYYYFKNDPYKTIRRFKIYTKINICKFCLKEYYYVDVRVTWPRFPDEIIIQKHSYYKNYCDGKCNPGMCYSYYSFL